MGAAARYRTESNRLLPVLAAASVLLHALILLHAEAPLPPEPPRCVSFTLRPAPPPRRTVPSPPVRPSLPAGSAERLQPVPPPPHRVAAVRTDSPPPPAPAAPVRAANDRPEPAPDLPDLQVVSWHPPPPPAETAVPSRPPPPPAVRKPDPKARDRYLSEVRLRIDGQKRYPRAARLRKFQGTVLVEFVLMPSGDVKSVQVVEGSRFEILNREAFRAVEKAAPYPEPPSGLFQGEIRLRIPVVFELI